MLIIFRRMNHLKPMWLQATAGAAAVAVVQLQQLQRPMQLLFTWTSGGSHSCSRNQPYSGGPPCSCTQLYSIVQLQTAVLNRIQLRLAARQAAYAGNAVPRRKCKMKKLLSFDIMYLTFEFHCSCLLLLGFLSSAIPNCVTNRNPVCTRFNWNICWMQIVTLGISQIFLP